MSKITLFETLGGVDVYGFPSEAGIVPRKRGVYAIPLWEYLGLSSNNIIHNDVGATHVELYCYMGNLKRGAFTFLDILNAPTYAAIHREELWKELHNIRDMFITETAYEKTHSFAKSLENAAISDKNMPLLIVAARAFLIAKGLIRNYRFESDIARLFPEEAKVCKEIHEGNVNTEDALDFLEQVKQSIPLYQKGTLPQAVPNVVLNEWYPDFLLNIEAQLTPKYDTLIERRRKYYEP